MSILGRTDSRKKWLIIDIWNSTETWCAVPSYHTLLLQSRLLLLLWSRLNRKLQSSKFPTCNPRSISENIPKLHHILGMQNFIGLTLVWWGFWSVFALLGFRYLCQPSLQHLLSLCQGPVCDKYTHVSRPWREKDGKQAVLSLFPSADHGDHHLEGQEDAAIGWPQLLVHGEGSHFDWMRKQNKQLTPFS